MEQILQQFFSFTTLIEGLKKIERFKGHFYWRDYPELARYESVADHSWRVAILVMLFEDKLARKIDVGKAIKMALIHDLAEVITGDGKPMEGDGTGNMTYANDEVLKQEKFQREKAAAKKLFSKLPEQLGNELFNIWMECESKSSYEAQVVKALDRIECSLQVLEYRNSHVFQKHHEFNLDYGFRGSDVDPAIYKFGQLVAHEMKKRYKEFKQ